MAYGFTVYTDRYAIEMTDVYSQTSKKTYQYAYGTGQQTLGGFTDGDYLEFTATPRNGYNFSRWVYHIGSTTATTKYSTSNPFKYYGSTGNDIYIAAEGETIGLPQLESVTYTITGSRVITVSLIGYNLIGYTVTLGLSYTDNTSMTIIQKIPITSNSFSTTITAASYATATLSVVFDPGGAFAKAYNFPHINLDGGGDEDKPDYFAWSSAVSQGLPVRNVSHYEWDDFIDKILEVLSYDGSQNTSITSAKYGYPIGTTYQTMLEDCFTSYDYDFDGYPLTAKMFNVSRFIIGSNVKTYIEDMTSYSSKVLASDFITLENCLNEWIDDI